MKITTQYNLASKSSSELKGLYCILLNKLTASYLTLQEQEQTLAALNKVKAELQLRCIL